MTPVAEESGSPEPVSYAATECDLAAGEYPADGEEPLSYPNPGKQKRRFSVFQGFVVIMLLVISAFLMRLVVDANRSRESSQVLTSRLSGSQDDSAAAEDDLSSSSKGSSKKTASPGDALSNSSKGNTPKGSSAKGVKAGTSKSSMPAGSSPIESPTEEGQTTSNKSTSPTRTSVKAGKAKSVDDSADEPDVSEPPPPMQGPPNLFGPPPWYNPYPPPSQGKGNGSKKGDPPGKSGSGYFDGPPYFGPGYQPGHWHWHDDDHWAEYYYETSPGFVTGKGKGKGGGGHWWDHIEIECPGIPSSNPTLSPATNIPTEDLTSSPVTHKSGKGGKGKGFSGSSSSFSDSHKTPLSNKKNPRRLGSKKGKSESTLDGFNGYYHNNAFGYGNHGIYGNSDSPRVKGYLKFIADRCTPSASPSIDQEDPPSHQPTAYPSVIPTRNPAGQGSTRPTSYPSTVPTGNPSSLPPAEFPFQLNGNATVVEDIAKNIGRGISIVKIDPNDPAQLKSITFRGFPANSNVSYVDDAGNMQIWLVGPNGGSYLTLTDSDEARLRDRINSFLFSPPADSDVDFDLNVTLVSSNGIDADTENSFNFPVILQAVADLPSVSAGNVTLAESEDDNLSIDVSRSRDHDGSEILSVSIRVPIDNRTGLPIGELTNDLNISPPGIVFANLGNGLYSVISTNLDSALSEFALKTFLSNGIKFTPVPGLSGEFIGTNGIVVEVVATERADRFGEGLAPNNSILDGTGGDMNTKVESAFGFINVVLIAIRSGAPSFPSAIAPTSDPSVRSSSFPTDVPSVVPSLSPSTMPSLKPSLSPSSSPSSLPSVGPSLVPSIRPSTTLSDSPSTLPTGFPSTGNPSSMPSGGDFAFELSGNSTVNEDAATNIGQNIQLINLFPQRPDTLSSISITGFPANSNVTIMNMGNLEITLVGPFGATVIIEGDEAEIRQQLSTLSVQPPPDSDSDFTLAITVTTVPATNENTIEVFDFPVVVLAVADEPTVTANNLFIDENGSQRLMIFPNRSRDSDNTETLSLVITVGSDGVGPIGSISPAANVNVPNVVFTSLGNGMYLVNATGDTPELREAALDVFLSFGVEFSARPALIGTFLGPDGIQIQLISTENASNVGTDLAGPSATDPDAKTESSFTFIDVIIAPLNSESPSMNPSTTPSGFPSKEPSTYPTRLPSISPSKKPSTDPTWKPSEEPSLLPSSLPSLLPSSLPTLLPSRDPSTGPSELPSARPSSIPSSTPSGNPTAVPSAQPSLLPSNSPSALPSTVPSVQPSSSPSENPSQNPSSVPSSSPSMSPSSVPSTDPSRMPTSVPSTSPSVVPSSVPSAQPSLMPSQAPSVFDFNVNITGSTTIVEDVPKLIGPDITVSLIDMGRPDQIADIVISSIPPGTMLTYIDPAGNTQTATFVNPAGGTFDIPGANEAQIRAVLNSIILTGPPQSDTDFILDITVRTTPMNANSNQTFPFPVGVLAVADNVTVTVVSPLNLRENAPGLIGVNPGRSVDQDGTEVLSVILRVPMDSGNLIGELVPLGTVPGVTFTEVSSGVYTVNSTLGMPELREIALDLFLNSTLLQFQPRIGLVGMFLGSAGIEVEVVSTENATNSDLAPNNSSADGTGGDADTKTASTIRYIGVILSPLASSMPSLSPSESPSRLPSASPTDVPSRLPSVSPSRDPSSVPSLVPSRLPSGQPSQQPSAQPSLEPTSAPSAVPSASPSSLPSRNPSTGPSELPSARPSSIPSSTPSGNPTAVPSAQPSLPPSNSPSALPSTVPSVQPSSSPSRMPTSHPSNIPSLLPSQAPSVFDFNVNITGSTTIVEDVPKLIGPDITVSLIDMGRPDQIADIVISSIPPGTMLTYIDPAGNTQTATFVNPAGGTFDIPGANEAQIRAVLNSIILTGPPQSDTDFILDITVRTTPMNANSNQTFPFPVGVLAVADNVTVTVVSPLNLRENAPGLIGVNPGRSVDQDGTEVLSVILRVPMDSGNLIGELVPLGTVPGVTFTEVSSGVYTVNSTLGTPELREIALDLFLNSTLLQFQPRIGLVGMFLGSAGIEVEVVSTENATNSDLAPNNSSADGTGGDADTKTASTIRYIGVILSPLASSMPSLSPSESPSRLPSASPTDVPSRLPSVSPSRDPSSVPSLVPSRLPSGQPSQQPSAQPSLEPTSAPSAVPSASPSSLPSRNPSTGPSELPSARPSSIPSSTPSGNPTAVPSAQPSLLPSNSPSALPSTVPSVQPSSSPSENPSQNPSSVPSSSPSMSPSSVPSTNPSRMPTSVPSTSPSAVPSSVPSAQPSLMPSQAPSVFDFNVNITGSTTIVEDVPKLIGPDITVSLIDMGRPDQIADIVISSIPPGTMLTYIDPAGNTQTATFVNPAGGTFDIPGANEAQIRAVLNSIILTGPPQSDTDFILDITVRTTPMNANSNQTFPFPVGVLAVADNVTVTVVSPLNLRENAPGLIGVNPGRSVDQDGTEVLSVILRVPMDSGNLIGELVPLGTVPGVTFTEVSSGVYTVNSTLGTPELREIALDLFLNSTLLQFQPRIGLVGMFLGSAGIEVEVVSTENATNSDLAPNNSSADGTGGDADTKTASTIRYIGVILSPLASSMPSLSPSESPSRLPSASPTDVPSRLPSVSPSRDPSSVPSLVPSRLPSGQPSQQPSAQPSLEPTSAPSAVPSASPSSLPSRNPSTGPSELPSARPSSIPSSTPSGNPTAVPSAQPSLLPSNSPSALPSTVPSVQPSSSPSENPSQNPSSVPSSSPSMSPSSVPSTNPSRMPTSVPSTSPSAVPSSVPSAQPSLMPSQAPSVFDFNVNITGSTTIVEDVPKLIGPDITVSLIDTGRPDQIADVVISSIPPGTMLTYIDPAGNTQTATFVNPAGGTFDIPGANEAQIRAVLNSIILTGPPQSDTDFILDITVRTTPMNANSNQTFPFPVGVLAVADNVTVTVVSPLNLRENAPGLIGVNPGRSVDQDGTEVLSVILRVPMDSGNLIGELVPLGTVPGVTFTEVSSGVYTVNSTLGTPELREIALDLFLNSTLLQFQPRIGLVGMFLGSAGIEVEVVSTENATNSDLAPNNSSADGTGGDADTKTASTIRYIGVILSPLASSMPSLSPSESPSRLPSASPTDVPSRLPSVSPSRDPSSVPSLVPSRLPSGQPSQQPSAQPSLEPSSAPSAVPSASPSSLPSRNPSTGPSELPSARPSSIPSSTPSGNPTAVPSAQPSLPPSNSPSALPSTVPSVQPSSSPSENPSQNPSSVPSSSPSMSPSSVPSTDPSRMPTSVPSTSPSAVPSSVPSAQPSLMPSQAPSVFDFNVNITGSTTIVEDVPKLIGPDITVSLIDMGRPDQIADIVISSIPPGTILLYTDLVGNNQTVTFVNPAGGTFDIPGANEAQIRAVLNSIILTGPPQSDTDFILDITVRTTPMNANSNQTFPFPVEVLAVADNVTVTVVSPLNLRENAPGLIVVNPGRSVDQDGTEVLSVILRVPMDSGNLIGELVPLGTVPGVTFTEVSSGVYTVNSTLGTPELREIALDLFLNSTLLQFQPRIGLVGMFLGSAGIEVEVVSTENATNSDLAPNNSSADGTGGDADTKTASTIRYIGVILSPLASSMPSLSPSESPSRLPSASPTDVPSRLPSVSPSRDPSSVPSLVPSRLPSSQPSASPSGSPSASPSGAPSSAPSATPSMNPSSAPSLSPSGAPSGSPSSQPSTLPSARPSSTPSEAPSLFPYPFTISGSSVVIEDIANEIGRDLVITKISPRTDPIASIRIGNIPFGATVVYTNSGGSLVSFSPLNPAGGAIEITGPDESTVLSRLNALNFTAPANSDVEIVLNVTVTSSPANSNSAESALFPVTVLARADPPSIGTLPIDMNEDEVNIPVSINPGRSVDNDNSEVLSIVLTVPNDGNGPIGTLSRNPLATIGTVVFTDLGNGVYTVNTTGLETETPSARELVLDSFLIAGNIRFTPRPQLSGVFPGMSGIRVDAVSTEVNATAADLAPNDSLPDGTANDLDTKIEVVTAYVSVTIRPLSDLPFLVSPNLIVQENNNASVGDPALVVPIGQSLNFSMGADADGSQTVAMTISGFPTDATNLRFNTSLPGVTTTVNLATGVATIAGANGTNVQTVLESLLVTLANDDDENFVLTLAGSAFDTNGQSNTSNPFSLTFEVVVQAAADEPEVTVGSATKPFVDEGSPFVTYPVSFTSRDTDGSESITRVQIVASTVGAGMPPDLNFGNATGFTVGLTTSGATTTAIVQGTEAALAAALQALQVRPGSDNGEDISVAVTVFSVETNTTEPNDMGPGVRGSEISSPVAAGTASFQIPVNPVISQPVLNITGTATGMEDTIFRISGISVVALSPDPDGSELPFLEIRDDPSVLMGVTFFNGANQSVGVRITDANTSVDYIRFTQSEFTNLGVRGPPNFSGTFNISVRGVIVDLTATGDNQVAGMEQPVLVNVQPVADAVLFTQNLPAIEDINPVLFGLALEDTLSVVDNGLPNPPNNPATETISVIQLDFPMTLSALFNGTAVPTAAGPVSLGNGVTISYSADRAIIRSDLLTANMAILATLTQMQRLAEEALIRDALALFSVNTEAHSDDNPVISVTVTTVDVNLGLANLLDTTLPFTIGIDANADTPNVTVVNSAPVNEDVVGGVPILINAFRSADTDGSETLSVRVYVPSDGNGPFGVIGRGTGASSSIRVTPNAAGDQFLIEATTGDAGMRFNDLNTFLTSSGTNGIKFFPREDFAGIVTLQVEAISTERANGADLAPNSFGLTNAFAKNESTFAATTLNITIQPIPDTPLIRGNAIGFEDTPIDIPVEVTLTDVDGSENFTLVIYDGVPPGTQIFGAGNRVILPELNGDFILTPADVIDWMIIAPGNYSSIQQGDIVLRVNVTVNDTVNGVTALSSFQEDITVFVEGVADKPDVLNVTLLAVEDQPYLLGAAILAASPMMNITLTLNDLDGSERLSLIIGGVPPGVVPRSDVDGGVSFLGGGLWQVSPEAIPTLRLPSVPNYSGSDPYNNTLTLRTTSQEKDANQTVSDFWILRIDVQPQITGAQADGFSSWGLGEATTEGAAESGTPVRFGSLLNYNLADPDSENATLFTVDLTNLLAGAQINQRAADLNSTTIQALIDNNLLRGIFTFDGSGIITILPDDVATVELDGSLFLDSNIDFTLPVTATVEDLATFSDGSNITVNTTESGNLLVSITGTADVPTVSVSSTAISGIAGDPIPITIGGVSTDTDIALLRNLSEEVYYIIQAVGRVGISDFAVTNAGGTPIGVAGDSQSWVLTESDLTATVNNTIYIRSSAAVNGSIDFTLTSVAVDDGDRARNSINFVYNVSASGSPGNGTDVLPLAPFIDVGPSQGNEDGSIFFSINATVDPLDPTTPVISLVISDIPPGATFTGGTFNPVTNTFVTTQAAIDSGLVFITAPPDFSGVFNVTAEGIALNPVSLLRNSTGPFQLQITVDPVADIPSISASPPTGTEDTPIGLNLIVGTTDIDGSEIVGNFTYLNVSGGATLLGSYDLVTLLDSDAMIGNFSVVGFQRVPTGDVPGLQVLPPPNFHGQFPVSVVSTSVEPTDDLADPDRMNSAFFTFEVSVVADADAPLITVPMMTILGQEDTEFDLLGLSSMLADTVFDNGAEILSAVISNVPPNSLFSTGSNNGDQSWTIPVASLPSLRYTPPPNFAGTITMNLTSFTIESSNGDVNSSSALFMVDIAPVADMFLILVEDVDNLGPGVTVRDLILNVRMSDTRGDFPGELPAELIQLVFSNVPEGVYLLPQRGGQVEAISGGFTFTGTEMQANNLKLALGPNGFTVPPLRVAVEAFSLDGTQRLSPGVIDSFRLVVRNATTPGMLANFTSNMSGITFNGTLGNDFIIGSPFADVLRTAGGADRVRGGMGADTLVASAGPDVFVYMPGDLNGRDTINAFNTISPDVDVLDLFALFMPRFDPVFSDITNFVQTTAQGLNTIVSVDTSGSGTTFTEVALLVGVTRSLTQLYDGGSLLL